MAPFGVTDVPNFISPSTQKMVCSIGIPAIGWPAPLVGVPGLGPGSNTFPIGPEAPERGALLKELEVLEVVTAPVSAAVPETPAGMVVSTLLSLAGAEAGSVVVNSGNVETVVGVLEVSIGVGVGVGLGTGVGLGDGVIVAVPDGVDERV